MTSHVAGFLSIMLAFKLGPSSGDPDRRAQQLLPMGEWVGLKVQWTRPRVF